VEQDKAIHWIAVPAPPQPPARRAVQSGFLEHGGYFISLVPKNGGWQWFASCDCRSAFFKGEADTEVAAINHAKKCIDDLDGVEICY
jgi:hypothetical protein